jgi:CBS domain-containing protein
MLTVRDIMTKDVVTFSPETTIREAIEGLTVGHLSGAPVLAGKRVVGVVSLTDLLSLIVTAPEAESSEESETVAEAWEESETEEMSEDDMNAVLSDDMLDEWVQNSDGMVDDASPDTKSLIDQHTVEEAMTREVISVKPGASVKKAAVIMQQHGIHRLLVMEGKTLQGIVSALDIARTVSERGVAGESGIKLDPCPGDPSPWIDV